MSSTSTGVATPDVCVDDGVAATLRTMTALLERLAVQVHGGKQDAQEVRQQVDVVVTQNQQIQQETRVVRETDAQMVKQQAEQADAVRALTVALTGLERDVAGREKCERDAGDNVRVLHSRLRELLAQSDPGTGGLRATDIGQQVLAAFSAMDDVDRAVLLQFLGAELDRASTHYLATAAPYTFALALVDGAAPDRVAEILQRLDIVPTADTGRFVVPNGPNFPNYALRVLIERARRASTRTLTQVVQVTGPEGTDVVEVQREQTVVETPPAAARVESYGDDNDDDDVDDLWGD
jgi:hypothetical protein